LHGRRDQRNFNQVWLLEPSPFFLKMGHRKKGNKEGGEDIFLVDILYYCSHLNLKLQSLLDVALIGDVQFSLQFGFEKGHWVFHTV